LAVLVWMSLMRWALVLPGLGSSRADAEGAARIRELVHAHLDAICRSARRLGVPAREIDDVVQDVMLVVVRRLPDIEAGKERAFVVGTTARVAANRRRRRQRRPEEPSDALEHIGDTRAATRAGGEGAIDTARQLALLDVALDAMTEPQRTAFVLFELEELTARQIGEQLGVSETTIVSRVRRAREVIWQVFEDHGYPGLGARRGAARDAEPTGEEP
jgi:RNA polymerase sigma-70 factor (ECF subfamily)